MRESSATRGGSSKKNKCSGIKEIESLKIFPQVIKKTSIPRREKIEHLELETNEVSNLELPLNQSPIPVSKPISNPVAQDSKDDIKKHLLPIISDTDEYGLITEAPTDHLSLDELPILRRIFAGIIDIAILSGMNLLLIGLACIIVKASLSALLGLKYYFILLFVLIHYFYYSYFTLIYQGTPGKLLMELRVISLANLKSSKLTFQQISWRWLTMMGGIIVLFSGMLYMVFDDNHAALQDRLSLSLVVSKHQFDALKNE